jgi:hypothetical protein
MSFLKSIKLIFTKWKVSAEKFNSTVQISSNSWVKYSPNNDFVRFFFENENDLFVHENGMVFKGKWQILNSDNFIFLQYNNQDFIYKYSLVENSVFVCYDEFHGEAILLFNDKKYSKEQVEAVFSIWISSAFNFFLRLLDDGSVLFVEGAKVWKDNSVVDSGNYKTIDGEVIEVQSGEIVGERRKWAYSFYEDGLSINHANGSLPKIGCSVYINDQTAIDGVYRAMSSMYIRVNLGIISELSSNGIEFY